MKPDTRQMLLNTVIQLPAWAYLGYWNWRVALAIALVMWGNNLDLFYRIPRRPL